MRFEEIIMVLVVSVSVGGVNDLAVEEAGVETKVEGGVEEAMAGGGMLLVVVVVVVDIQMQGMGALGPDWIGLLRSPKEAVVMEGSHDGVCIVAERCVEMCVACL